MMQDFLQWLPTFAEVMDRRYYTPAWLVGEVWSGRARFWSTEQAALVTEIRIYPTGVRDLHFLVAAGDLDTVIENLRPEAEAWGRSIGCVAALVESRAGWARTLAPLGYELHQTIIRKEL